MLAERSWRGQFEPTRRRACYGWLVSEHAFGPWYPLEEASRHAPTRAGVFQIKIPAGMIEYTRGKSAMVHYGEDADLRAAIEAFAATCADVGGLRCRHTDAPSLSEAAARAALFQRLYRAFVDRFGEPPRRPARPLP